MRTAGRDFGNNQQARDHIEAVIRVLSDYISDGEMDDVKAQLPQPITQLFEQKNVDQMSIQDV